MILLFYVLFFIIIFFNGLDNVLLYDRTFIPNQKFEFINYFHFYSGFLASWLIGYFVIQKIVKKYEPSYVLRVSLLISSLIIWIQYQYLEHQMEYLFSKTIVDNLICSINLNLMYYSVISFTKKDKNFVLIKKNYYYLFFMFFLGMIYSNMINYDNLSSGFLISSLIYFCCYLFLFIFKIDDLNTSEIDYKYILFKATVLTFLLVFLCVFMLKSKFLNNFTFLSESSTPIFFYIILLFSEGIISYNKKI